MASAPPISVALVAYNQERFVAEAIAGLLSQTYRPLEIVIVDDCSSDNTAAIVEAELAKARDRRDARFIRHQKNLGANIAFRTAIETTTGDFIHISAGDDVMLPELVAEMAAVWHGANVSLVTANAHYIDEDSAPLGRTFRDPDRPADDSFETLARDGGNACCFGPAIGFERAVYEKFGWPSPSLGGYDIMLPFWAYLLKGARFINKPLLKYRVHGRNTSMSLQAERSDEIGRLIANERIFYQHLAHSLLMREEVDRMRGEDPSRYASVAETILPLLTIQTIEMGKKLVRARAELDARRAVHDIQAAQRQRIDRPGL